MDTVKTDSVGSIAEKVRWKRARSIFQGIKARCKSRHHHSWKHYGGRGIECRFSSAEELVDEIGLPPPGHSINRINIDGHYESGNVEWVDRVTSIRQRRPYYHNHGALTPKDVKKIVSLYRAGGITQLQIAKRFKVSPHHVNMILNGKAWQSVTGIVPRKKVG